MLQCPPASGNSGYKLTAQPSLVSNLRMFVLDQMLLRSSVIFLQANQGQWFLLTGDAWFFILFTAYPNPLCVPHGSTWQPSLSGTVSTRRLVSGLACIPCKTSEFQHQDSTRDIPGFSSPFLPHQFRSGGAPPTFQ